MQCEPEYEKSKKRIKRNKKKETKKTPQKGQNIKALADCSRESVQKIKKHRLGQRKLLSKAVALLVLLLAGRCLLAMWSPSLPSRPMRTTLPTTKSTLHRPVPGPPSEVTPLLPWKPANLFAADTALTSCQNLSTVLSLSSFWVILALWDSSAAISVVVALAEATLWMLLAVSRKYCKRVARFTKRWLFYPQCNPGIARVVGGKRFGSPRKGWKRRHHVRLEGFTPPFVTTQFWLKWLVAKREFSRMCKSFSSVFFSPPQVQVRTKWTGRAGTTTVNGTQFLRGGAGGSSTSKRKQTESKILEGIEELLHRFKPVPEQSVEDRNQSFLLEKLQGLISAKPSAQSILQSLEQILNDFKSEASLSPPKPEKSKGTGRNKIQTSTNGVSKQSFYGDFWAKAKTTEGLAEGTAKINNKQSFPQSVAGFWAGKDVVDPAALFQQLEKGAFPKGKLAFVTAAQASELQSIARSHELQGEFTLMIEASCEQDKLPIKAEARYFEFEKRGVTKVFAAPLCPNQSLTALQKPVVVHKVETKLPVRPKELITFRITVLKLLQDSKEWRHVCRRPEVLLSSIIDKHLAKAYQWHEICGDELTYLTGYLKVDPTLEDTLTKFSGTQGIFTEKLSPPGAVRSPVNWIRREPQEEISAYLGRAQKLGSDKSKPLAFRKGGGTCLGLVGDYDETKFSTWVVQGLPWFWGPMAVQQWLEEKNWKLGDHPMSPPRNKKQGWILNLCPPPNTNRDAVHLFVGKTEQDEEFRITIKRWIRTQKQFKELPKGKNSGWFQPSRSQTIAATQLDEDIDENVENREVGAADTPMPGAEVGAKRTSQVGTGISPFKKKVKSTPSNLHDRHHIPGLEGFEHFDLGGSGECGWLSLAAGISQTHNKTPQQVRENADSLAKTLHGKVINSLATVNTTWKASWAPDDATDAIKEAGPVATNLDDFIQSLFRYKRWVCGLVLEGAAQHLRVVIVIFEVRNGRWTRTAVLNEGGGKHIIPFLLYEDHFTTLLKPPKGFPKEWGVVNGQDKTWEGRAAGPESLSSWVAPASIAGSSWIRPHSTPSQGKSVRSVGTHRTKASAKVRPSPKTKERIKVSRSTSDASSSKVSQRPFRPSTPAKAAKPDTSQTSKHSWVCPVCHKCINCQTQGGLSCAKRFHLKSRHPSFNLNLVNYKLNPTVIETSDLIPREQRGWSCPLCDTGLPYLPNQDRLRAIRKHCDKHPGETPFSLYVKSQRGKPKTGTAKALVVAHATERKKRFRSHDVVSVSITKEERKNSSDRGNAYYCKKCLGQLGKKQYKIHELSCFQTRQAIKKDTNVQIGKRRWWENVQKHRPKHCAEFLKQTGWSKEQVDSYFNVAAFANSTRKRVRS